jgi:hypothetical protein
MTFNPQVLSDTTELILTKFGVVGPALKVTRLISFWSVTV